MIEYSLWPERAKVKERHPHLTVHVRRTMQRHITTSTEHERRLDGARLRIWRKFAVDRARFAIRRNAHSLLGISAGRTSTTGDGNLAPRMWRIYRTFRPGPTFVHRSNSRVATA
jgi:hypothetical protein